MSRPRIAVVGAGHLGRIHARLALSGGLVELVAVCDPLAAARAAAATELGVTTLHDHRPLLDQVDGVIVATPTTHHAAVACDFLRHGIPTLVEKPLAISTREAEAMVAAARDSGAILQVGHVERFNPAWTALGAQWNQACYFEANRASSYSFRSTDIGVVHDLMIHDLDLVLSRCSAPLRHVHSTLITVLGPHEDIAHARLEFADGRVALLRASRVSMTAERSMLICADHGHAVLDFASPSATIIGRGTAARELDESAGPPTAAERESLQQRLFLDLLPTHRRELEKRNAIADEQADWVRAIQCGTPPQVTGADGLRAIQVAERILQAGVRSTVPADMTVPRDGYRRAG